MLQGYYFKTLWLSKIIYDYEKCWLFYMVLLLYRNIINTKTRVKINRITVEVNNSLYIIDIHYQSCLI